MVKSWWTAATAMAVLAGVLLIAGPGFLDDPAEDTELELVGRGAGRPGDRLHFRLEGKPVRGLYPGAVKQMRISVRNPLGFRLSVQQLTAKVTASSQRGCPATSANLRVEEYTGKLPAMVAASGRTELGGAVPIVMPAGASQKCAGARFTVSISGVGHRVAR